MMYTLNYANDPIFARDFLIETIGKVVEPSHIIDMINHVTFNELKYITLDDVEKMLIGSPTFREVWEHAKNSGMPIDPELIYVYNADDKTIADVLTPIDYVDAVGCATAFAKYAITNKEVMKEIASELSKNELEEITTLVSLLK